MGNTCSCDNRQDEHTNQQLQSENTPRHDRKPEKLPSMSHAVKSSLKKINTDRLINQENNGAGINPSNMKNSVQVNPNMKISNNQVNDQPNGINNVLNNSELNRSNIRQNAPLGNEIDNAKQLIQDRRYQLEKVDTKVLVPDHVLKSQEQQRAIEQAQQQQLLLLQQQQQQQLQQQLLLQQQQQQLYIQQQQQLQLQQQNVEVQKLQAAFQANQRLKDLEESKGDKFVASNFTSNQPNNQINNNQYNTPLQSQNNYQQVNNNQGSNNPSRPQSIEPKTLYDKLGGDEGLKFIVDGTFKKVMADPSLEVFFKNIQLEVHQEKFRYFLGYLTGGHQHWIGQNLTNAHKGLKIDDALFDKFVKHCMDAVKELRIKHDGINTLKEMVKSLQSLRDQIVFKPEDEPPKSLLERMGGNDGIKVLCEKTMQKILECPKLKPYFDSTPITLHQKRLAYYIISMIGGEDQEWIGRSLKQAHKGKEITEMHFDLFLHYFEKSALELQLAEKETVQEFIDQLKVCQKEVVDENKSLTLLEKIDNNDFFEPVMNRFVDKMMRDHILGRYFQNMKMKHMIPNKIMLFFAYSKGIMNPDDKQSIKEYHQDLKITPEDFERSIIFFKEALYEFCIDPAVVEEAVNFYKTLRRQLAYFPEDHLEEIQKEALEYKQQSMRRNEEEKLENINLAEQLKLSIEEKDKQNIDSIINNVGQSQPPPVLKKSQQLLLEGKINNQNEKRDSDNRISSFRLESEINNKQSEASDNLNKSPSNFHKINKPPVEVVESLKVIEEQEKLEESQARDLVTSIKNDKELSKIYQTEVLTSHQLKDLEIDNQQVSLNKMSLALEKPQEQQKDEIEEQQNDQIIDQVEQIKQKEDLNMPSNQQSQKPMDQSVRDRSKTPQKRPLPQIEYKYFFYDLLSGDTVRTSEQRSVIQSSVFQGELNRFMEKQKSQLPRWLTLNSKALMIYKDELYSRSFPTKPLYCIPLQEIKDIKTKEALLHPNQRKSQALHFMEIQLKEPYGIIAQSIAQLLTGKTIMMGGGFGRHDSPLRETQKNNQQKKPVSHQNHSYDDEVLVFVSQQKKSIQDWAKKLKGGIKMFQSESVALLNQVQNNINNEDIQKVPTENQLPEEEDNLQLRIQQQKDQEELKKSLITDLEKEVQQNQNQMPIIEKDEKQQSSLQLHETRQQEATTSQNNQSDQNQDYQNIHESPKPQNPKTP